MAYCLCCIVCVPWSRASRYRASGDGWLRYMVTADPLTFDQLTA
jgi:hypothetical protein